MELLLNLCWFLLIAPAFFLWTRRRPYSKPLQCLIALACLLVLLFPVISATDDLHPMRQEMEESGSSKRLLRQAGVEKATAQNHFSSPPTQLTASFSVQPCNDISGSILFKDAFVTKLAQRNVRPGRAPPSFFLG